MKDLIELLEYALKAHGEGLPLTFLAPGLRKIIYELKNLDWQPMETIPTDGTVVLVKVGSCEEVELAYMLKGWLRVSANGMVIHKATSWRPLPR